MAAFAHALKHRCTMSLHEEIVDTVLEFLEATVHTVLYAKQVYPKEAFGQCRIFQSKHIHKCRHPKVTQYIGGVLFNLKSLILRGVVSELAICFLDQQQRVVQRLVLQVEKLLLQPTPGEVDWTELNNQFTNSLAKLEFVDNFSSVQIQPGCGWELHVHCVSREGVDMSFWEDCSASATRTAGPAQAVPFKTINVPNLLRLQVFLEEPGQHS